MLRQTQKRFYAQLKSLLTPKDSDSTAARFMERILARARTTSAAEYFDYLTSTNHFIQMQEQVHEQIQLPRIFMNTIKFPFNTKKVVNKAWRKLV